MLEIDREQRYRELAGRGKYQRLYWHLVGLAHQKWPASFREVEAVLGFALPPSARLHRPWWANQGGRGGHSQALAWAAAGWETAEVDIEAERLVFRPRNPGPHRSVDLDELWPVHSTQAWQLTLSLGRADLYEERV